MKLTLLLMMLFLPYLSSSQASARMIFSCPDANGFSISTQKVTDTAVNFEFQAPYGSHWSNMSLLVSGSLPLIDESRYLPSLRLATIQLARNEIDDTWEVTCMYRAPAKYSSGARNTPQSTLIIDGTKVKQCRIRSQRVFCD